MYRYDNLAVTARACGVPRAALMGPEVTLVRAVQTARGTNACFRTDSRLSCRELGCEWRSECCRPVAVWRR